MAQLRKAVAGDRTAAVTAFWEEIRKAGTPLVESVPGEPEYSWVTFLWQAKDKTGNVVIIDGVASGVGGLDPSKSLMTRLSGTDVWYRTYKVRNDAAFSYWISPNDSMETIGLASRRSQPQADPLNPRRSGPQSYIELPGALTTPEIAVAKGRGEVTKLPSALMKNERPAIIYTPPGYEPNGTRYPLLVMLDGAAFTSLADMRPILDRLIDLKQIPPVLAVFVGPATPDSRIADMSCNDVFATILAKDVVPWMRDKYHATTEAANTIVGGASLSGLEAMFAGFRHSDVFGKVLSLSGSYWWAPAGDAEPSWLARQLASSAAVPVRVSMSVGVMEVRDQLDTNRHLRDVLIAKGYSLRYAEFNGNHGYVSWKSDLPRRIADLFAQQ